MIIAGVSLLVPRTAPAPSRCMECHPPGVAEHLSDWVRSRHASSGVTCQKCHQPRGDSETEPHAAERIVATCGNCHADVESVFRVSRHHAQPVPGERKPTCSDCHSTAGGSVMLPSELPRRCGECHDSGATVAQKATELLAMMREVTLARALLGDRVVVRRQQGGPVAAFDAALGRVDTQFRNIAIEWHRFDFDEVERRCRRAISDLEQLRDALEEE